MGKLTVRNGRAIVHGCSVEQARQLMADIATSPAPPANVDSGCESGGSESCDGLQLQAALVVDGGIKVLQLIGDAVGKSVPTMACANLRHWDGGFRVSQPTRNKKYGDF